MSAYLLEHLFDNCQGEGMFDLNINEVKMGLKDVALITRLRAATNFKLTEAQSHHLEIAGTKKD